MRISYLENFTDTEPMKFNHSNSRCHRLNPILTTKSSSNVSSNNMIFVYENQMLIVYSQIYLFSK